MAGTGAVCRWQRLTDETHGTTWGHWVASADTYGADRKWVLLKPVPIELDDEEMGEAAGSSANA